MSVEIIEIIDRSTQGITLPFICRSDDGKIYFVKGRGAGRRSLICEWVAGSLACALGLPVAPFAVVVIPQELIDLASRDDLSELGSGPAFGSCRRSVVELTVSHALDVAVELQRDILAFDWWVKNGDRTQTEVGGNPNLFWDVDSNGILVLDHNQAFDPAFKACQFEELHPFRSQVQPIFSDMMYREHYASRFEAAMTAWDDICNTIPMEWMYLDDECTIPLQFDLNALRQALLDCRSNVFWNLK